MASGDLLILSGATREEADIGLYWRFESWMRDSLSSLDSMFGNTGGVIGQSVWGVVARARSIGVAWAWSGLTLLLGIPLYWIARRSDPHHDKLDAQTHRRTEENSIE